MSKKLKRQGNLPKSRNAGLCVNHSDPRSVEAFEILTDAGFRVSYASVSGLTELQLNLGAETYEGIEEIREVAREAKRQQERSQSRKP